MRNTAKISHRLFAMVLALLAMASHAQVASADVCNGSDAVRGTAHAILEAGARVFVITSASGEHPDGGGIYISCNEGDAWYKYPGIYDGGAAIASDPADANTIYATIGGGYVYTSRDAGETWTSSRPVEFGNLSVSALATLAGGQVIAGMESGSLLRSDDYGASWQPLPGALPNERIHAVLVAPDNPNLILAVVNTKGVFQSLDGGQNFEPGTLSGVLLPLAYWDVQDIAFTPSNTSQVNLIDSTGLRLSVDGGYMYSFVNQISDAIDINFGRRDADTMFVVSEFAGVLRSNDGGQNFTLLVPDPPGPTDWFRSALQLTSGRLLVGTVSQGMYKSDDDGASWQAAGATPQQPTPAPAPNVTAKLSLSIENRNGNGTIEAGSEARFRIRVQNNGPDVSTNTFVHVVWSLPNTGGAISTAFTLSSSQGSCVITQYADSGCTIGNLGAGASVTVEFRGTTSTSYVGSHGISAFASNDQGAIESASNSVSTTKTILCIGDCGSKKSGGGSGGGAAGLPLLAVLLLLMQWRRMKVLPRHWQAK